MVEIIIKNEKRVKNVLKSRRVWSSLLTVGSIIAISFAPDKYELISQGFMAVASILGLLSWKFPDK